MPHKSKAARRAYQRRWAREINPVARADSKRRYVRAHPEVGARASARYARRRRERTFDRSDGRCYFCRALIDLATFVVDHRVPRSRGGADDERNTVFGRARAFGLPVEKAQAEWDAKRGAAPSTKEG